MQEAKRVTERGGGALRLAPECAGRPNQMGPTKY
jgi:hypothetical protein